MELFVVFLERGEGKNGFTFSSLSPSVSGSTPSPNHSLLAKGKDLNSKMQVSTKSSKKPFAILSVRFFKNRKKKKKGSPPTSAHSLGNKYAAKLFKLFHIPPAKVKSLDWACPPAYKKCPLNVKCNFKVRKEYLWPCCTLPGNRLSSFVLL